MEDQQNPAGSFNNRPSLLNANTATRSVSPFSHQVTSADDIIQLLSQRKTNPGFLMLDCEFRDVSFHPKDPRVAKFFDVFGPTLVQLKLTNAVVSHEVLQTFFKRNGKNLASFGIKIKRSVTTNTFPRIEDDIPAMLPKLGVLHIRGFQNLPFITCPNLLELHMDTLMRFRPQNCQLNFENLRILQLRSYSLFMISDIDIETLGEMKLRSLQILYLIDVSYNVPLDKLNGLLESFGNTLEELKLRMTEDHCNPTIAFWNASSRSSQRPFRNRRLRVSIQDIYHLTSPFPLRLPKLKKLSTNIDFQRESKVFMTLPRLNTLECNGTLRSVSHGVFTELRKLDLRMGNDGLLFDIYRSFPNLEELCISNGEHITDFGILGNHIYDYMLEEGNELYIQYSAVFDAKSIYFLKRLKKFWALLSPRVTDLSVCYGFSKCLQLEELGVSNSHITTESLKIIQKELVILKELQIRKCVHIPYLDVIRIFYNQGEKKVKVHWS